MFRKTYLLILISTLLLAGCGATESELEPSVESAVAEKNTVEVGEPDLPAQVTHTPIATEIIATETPIPTQEATQTPVPEPTDMPEPTISIEASPDVSSAEPPVPNGFAFYETLEGGYGILHPADWIAEDFFGLTFLATDEQILEDSENLESGAFMMIISVPEEELESNSLLENLGFATDGIHPDPAAGDPVILTEPIELDLNGYAAGQVLVEYPHSDTEPVTTLITLIKNEGRFISLMGSTPSSEASDYLPLLEAITSSITLMEPIEVEIEGGDFEVDSATYDEILTQPIRVGAPPVEVALPENSQVMLTFEANEGMVIDIEVASEEGTDLVLELTDIAGESLVGIVDQGFDTEEIKSYTIPESGLYNILVSEYGRLSGTFSAKVVEVEALETSDPADLSISGGLEIGEEIEAFLADGEVGSWQFEASAEDVLLFIIEPEEDFDVVFEIVDESGQLITDGEVDEEFSGGFETAILTIPADGLYTVQVSGFAGDGGRYSLSIE